MKINTLSKGKAQSLEVIETVRLAPHPKPATRAQTSPEQPSAPFAGAEVRRSRDCPDVTAEEFFGLTSGGAKLYQSPENDTRDMSTEDCVLVREHGELGILYRRIAVRFKASCSETECKRVFAEVGLETFQPMGFAPNLYVGVVPQGTFLGDMERRLSEEHANELVYAEPIIAKRVDSRRFRRPPPFEPKPTGFDRQWQWRKVFAEEAWSVSKGDGVRVAVIDRGFNWRHPLILPNVDQTLSAYLLEDGNLSHTLSDMPEYDHGTFSAAQVAAKPKKNGDVTGIAPDADLMLVCTPGLGESFLSQFSIALAVAYAVSPKLLDPSLPEKGADIVTCAEGPINGQGELSDVLADAFEFAHNQSVPVFWAVANRPIEIDKDEMVSHPALIRVGSSNAQDNPVCRSAFGPELDFLAPGEGVVNIAVRKPDLRSGTSFSTPVAAGIGALMLSKNPELTAQEIRTILRETCRKVGPLSDSHPRHDRYGSGIVHAGDAVARA